MKASLPFSMSLSKDNFLLRSLPLSPSESFVVCRLTPRSALKRKTSIYGRSETYDFIYTTLH